MIIQVNENLNYYLQNLCHEATTLLHVKIADQTMDFFQDGELIKTYIISSSKFGCGEFINSFKTPRGLFEIKEKIGDGLPIYTIFRGRKPVGALRNLAQAVGEHNNDDLILTRILWLNGLEDGKNRGGCVDAFTRYIYIHGTQAEELLGTPCSHGCIRMANKDILELYPLVSIGVKVLIL